MTTVNTTALLSGRHVALATASALCAAFGLYAVPALLTAILPKLGIADFTVLVAIARLHETFLATGWRCGVAFCSVSALLVLCDARLCAKNKCARAPFNVATLLCFSVLLYLATGVFAAVASIPEVLSLHNATAALYVTLALTLIGGLYLQRLLAAAYSPTNWRAAGRSVSTNDEAKL